MTRAFYIKASAVVDYFFLKCYLTWKRQDQIAFIIREEQRGMQKKKFAAKKIQNPLYYHHACMMWLFPNCEWTLNGAETERESHINCSSRIAEVCNVWLVCINCLSECILCIMYDVVVSGALTKVLFYRQKKSFLTKIDVTRDSKFHFKLSTKQS